MKRVSAELETVAGGPEEVELIVQGVRFAFRVHQVTFLFGPSFFWFSSLPPIAFWTRHSVCVQLHDYYYAHGGRFTC